MKTCTHLSKTRDDLAIRGRRATQNRRPGWGKALARIIVAVGLAGMIATAAPPAQPNTDMQTAKVFKFKKVSHAKVNYLLFLPKGYHASADKRWPLLLFLHGAGERGSDVWKVATHGPPKIVARDPNFPFIVVSPQCPEGEVWSTDQLLGLLDSVMKKLKVDAGRVYLTGLSMGGYGTWDLGLSHPERFAAIVPICGGGQIINILLAQGAKAQALRSLGVWAFHGGKDPVVPLEESQRLVERLKKVGVQDVKLTVYREAGHYSWTETYNDPKLYEWLLSHDRKP
jgi:predicted peptidase